MERHFFVFSTPKDYSNWSFSKRHNLLTEIEHSCDLLWLRGPLIPAKKSCRISPTAFFPTILFQLSANWRPL